MPSGGWRLRRMCHCQAFPAQPSRAQLSPDQCSPAQPGPSLGVGLAKALPKAFSDWIQMCVAQRSQSSPAQPSRCQSKAQPSSAWLSLAELSRAPSAAQANPSPAQRSSAQPSPAQALSSAKGFLLLDSDVAFSAVRFWLVWGRRAAAFRCLEA